MDRQQRVDNREKTLVDILLIVVLLTILMAVFIYYYLKYDQQYSDIGLNTASSTFSSQLAVIHSQWLMDSQPNVVRIKQQARSGEIQIRIVTVNKSGWPHSESATVPCVDIWLMVMDEPLQVLNSPVSVVEVIDTTKQVANGKICRYFVSEQQYFEYNSGNGELTKAN